MYSTFMGLETAYRGLITSQAAQNTTGHNITNAGTEGYSRQTANLTATNPLIINQNGKQMSIGTGSTAESITRARDSFIDRQYRRESSKYEYWSGKDASLNMVQSFLNESTEYSLNSDMTAFWNAWSDLANNPEQSSARVVVTEKALTLADTFKHVDTQITDLQSDLDSSVTAAITQINTISDQIGELNLQIRNAQVAGDNPNDLKDQRDVLVDELTKLVPVTVEESLDSAFTDRRVENYTVRIGDAANVNSVLVANDVAYHLDNNIATITWKAEGTKPAAAVALGSEMGSLNADLEMRDIYLVDFRDKINDFAAGIAQAVNEIHKTGQGLTTTTNLDFFTSSDANPISAANITVNPVLQADTQQIATGAAAATVQSGDSSVALKIAALASGWSTATVPIALGSAKSFQDYYEGMTAQMGSDVQQSTRMMEGQNVLVTQLSNSREEVSGVSLDEEMVNLIKFQKGYSSAARLVTTLDSMLDSILGMGVTK